MKLSLLPLVEKIVSSLISNINCKLMSSCFSLNNKLLLKIINTPVFLKLTKIIIIIKAQRLIKVNRIKTFNLFNTIVLTHHKPLLKIRNPKIIQAV